MEGKAYETSEITYIFRSIVLRGRYFLKVLVGTCNCKISILSRTIVVLYSTCPLLEEAWGCCTMSRYLLFPIPKKTDSPIPYLDFEQTEYFVCFVISSKKQKQRFLHAFYDCGF
ncbi:hypothetical protein OPV22_021045 [Ensete ventricosum]|uniref:Uncharacterized protein n=1 Tax=Ensete ventricosum TaxID=4639 RepID=A0AAV8QKB2_ENSVE|nr:hypothetical protein OPV22_021045 [Ensete ventricosum]